MSAIDYRGQTEYMTDLSMRSAKIRTARRCWKEALHDEPKRVLEVLDAPPDELATVPLPDLLLWVRGFGPEKLYHLGARAASAHQRVNLLIPLGRASNRTRQWVAYEIRKTQVLRP
jgi:hypothetical protein